MGIIAQRKVHRHAPSPLCRPGEIEKGPAEPVPKHFPEACQAERVEQEARRAVREACARRSVRDAPGLQPPKAKRPKAVAEQARNIPSAETFASQCADALNGELASLELPESAPLTADEEAGIGRSMLQGPELIEFVKEFVVWNEQRRGQRLSNSALFCYYFDEKTGKVVWVTPQMVPPAQPLALPLPLPLRLVSLSLPVISLPVSSLFLSLSPSPILFHSLSHSLSLSLLSWA